MPFDDILSSFLMKVNQCYLDNDIEVAQKEILQIICTEFSAVYCTVYLKKDDNYQQYLEYNLPETSSFSFELTNVNLHNKPFYIDKRENIHHIFPESQVQRYLYLPLLRKKKTVWFPACPLGQTLSV